jgi:hypothetical protein
MNHLGVKNVQFSKHYKKKFSLEKVQGCFFVCVCIGCLVNKKQSEKKKKKVFLKGEKEKGGIFV